jgi:flagellar hook-associated protein 2
MSIAITAVTTSEQTIAATYDETSAVATMQSIVDELNFVLSFLETETSYGEDGAEDGGLVGDPFATALKRTIRDYTSTAISGYGADDIYLSYFGVLTNLDGTLSLDTDTFSTYFNAYPDNFSAMTQSRASTDNFTPGDFSLTLSSSVASIQDSDGTSITMTDTGTNYIASSGNAIGLNLSTTLSDTTATVYMGMSLIDMMSNYFDDILQANADIDDKLSLLTDAKKDYTLDLEVLETRMASKRDIYQQQFGAMEGSVSSFRKTGDYMTSFMESWRAGL